MGNSTGVISIEAMQDFVHKWASAKGLLDAFHIDLRSARFHDRRLPIVRIQSRSLQALLELEDEKHHTIRLVSGLLEDRTLDYYCRLGQYERLQGLPAGQAILYPKPKTPYMPPSVLDPYMPPFIVEAGMRLQFFELPKKVSDLTTNQRDVVSEMS